MGNTKGNEEKETLVTKLDNLIGHARDHLYSATGAGAGGVVGVIVDNVFTAPPLVTASIAIATGAGLAISSTKKIRPTSFLVGGVSALALGFTLAAAIKTHEAPAVPEVSKDPIAQSINAPTAKAPAYKS